MILVMIDTIVETTEHQRGYYYLAKLQQFDQDVTIPTDSRVEFKRKLLPEVAVLAQAAVFLIPAVGAFGAFQSLIARSREDDR